MSAGTIVVISPHGRALIDERGWTTRPARLVQALIDAGHEVVVIARTPPWKTWRARQLLTWRHELGLVFAPRRRYQSRLSLLEHPWPAGMLERTALRRIVHSVGSAIRAVIVFDPRSAGVLSSRLPGLRVFDAYDAWDLSPLFSRRPRALREIRSGYRSAARAADLVIANTPFMATRMRSLGASNVHVVANGGPPPVGPSGGSERQGVLYVGNVQRRLRVDMLRAAADAAGRWGTNLRLVGAMQDEPDGWRELLESPAVQYLGPRYGDDLTAELTRARVGLIPHRIDHYTLSQDAMKAWDYLAHGLAIVSTSVPPASSSLAGFAHVADDPDDFKAAVSHALTAQDREDVLSARYALARRHTWGARAARVIDLIETASR